MNKTWKRKFFTIAIGQMASLIGSSAVQFALIWWIASETGSAIMMGLSGLVAFLPMTFLSPVAGIAADRYQRKHICIAADLFIGLVAAAFAVLLWIYDMPVWTALVILGLRSVGSTFHQPAIQALIPQIVPAGELTKVGGWNQLLASGSFLLGPALGAALYAAFPLPVVLLTDLLGALAASGLLAAVAVPKLEPAPQEHRSTLGELKEGLRVYLEDRPLLLIVSVETLCMIFYLPLASFYPLMTSDYFGASAWHGSAVEVAYALGMMVSALLFGSVIKVRRHLAVAYLGLLGIGVTAALCGMLPPTMWAWCVFTVTCGVMGGFGNVHSIPLVAYMQSSIPPEKMGRAFSFLALAGSFSMPVGLLIGSPVAEWVGVHMWFLISGIGIILTTAAGIAAQWLLQRSRDA